MKRFEYETLLAKCKTLEEVDQVAELFISDEDLSDRDFTALCFEAKERMVVIAKTPPYT